ncbi:hypothetical protein E2C01_062703 [Portunus trituberculatus]|uniref:Uncharacterized protein n=1 Tax=Portunus trituberculatus TaxID=210409 RepID=A0A5B7H746_PORTR|nr:hypothetical protein [Portunus trituberculatus]
MPGRRGTVEPCVLWGPRGLQAHGFESCPRSELGFLTQGNGFLAAVLLNVPLSLALPIIARHEHYHSSYEGRHLPPLLPDTSTSQHHYEYSSRDQDDVLHDDLHYFTETTKLASYFAYLKVR